MTDIQFYTILSFAWLAVAIMHGIVSIFEGKSRLKENLQWVLLPLLLFGAYSKIAELLSS